MRRSDCPIATTLDFMGDKWSLLVLRDIMFFGKHTYSELQASDEKVATNILSNRLEKLEQDGLIQKDPDPSDKRKKLYSLTEKGKDTLPILLEMMVWSAKHEPQVNAPEPLIERAINDRETLIKDLLANIQ